MKKTVDLSKEDVVLVEKFKTKNNLRTFAEALRKIIRRKPCSCSSEEKENKEILKKINLISERVEMLVVHLTPPKEAK